MKEVQVKKKQRGFTSVYEVSYIYIKEYFFKNTKNYKKKLLEIILIANKFYFFTIISKTPIKIKEDPNNLKPVICSLKNTKAVIINKT